MTYSHAKVQGQQRSVGSEDGVETNRRTDGGDRITFHTNVVGKYSDIKVHSHLRHFSH